MSYSFLSSRVIFRRAFAPRKDAAEDQERRQHAAAIIKRNTIEHDEDDHTNTHTHKHKHTHTHLLLNSLVISRAVPSLLQL